MREVPPPVVVVLARAYEELICINQSRLLLLRRKLDRVDFSSLSLALSLSFELREGRLQMRNRKCANGSV